MSIADVYVRLTNQKRVQVEMTESKSEMKTQVGSSTRFPTRLTGTVGGTLAVLSLALMVVVNPACNRVTPTTSSGVTPTISAYKAVAIAASQLPLAVIERSSVQVAPIGGWRIVFEGALTTQEELGWSEDQNTEFNWAGGSAEPPGTYRAVMVSVDTETGSITHRSATNQYFLGITYPPPPK